MAGGAGGAEPTEEQLRAAYAAELSRITSADMILQAAASLLNIGAYRLGLLGPEDPAAGGGGAPERDLEQVRDAIDAVRGLLEVIERSRPQELPPLRQALSQLQMAYAQAVQPEGSAPAPGAPATSGGAPSEPGGGAGEPAQEAPAGGQPSAPQPAAGGQRGPGPAESSGRLWVPGR